MKKFIKSSIKVLLFGFLFALGMIGGVYIYTRGFSTLSTATTGQSLSAQMWNDVIDRVSNIFRNSGTSNLELNGGIKIGNTATCDATTKGAMRFSGDRVEYCNTSGWNYFASTSLTIGTSGAPAISCLQIKQANSSSTDGLYWIQPSGESKVQVYCDMTNDGGGRTLVARGLTNTHTYKDVNAVADISSPTQSYNGKLSDVFINKLRTSSGGFRMTATSPGGNNYTDYWSYNCVFVSTTYQSPGSCNKRSDGLGRYGLSSDIIIFGHASYAGMRTPTGTRGVGSSGNVRVK